MQLPDVNVLVYAHREDAERHLEYRRWLEALIGGPSAFGISSLVLSAFLRIVTHPKIFKVPTPMDRALAFTARIREQPGCVQLTPGPRLGDRPEPLRRGGRAR